MAMVGKSDLTFQDNLRMLSEASVEKHFDAFLDIPWDDPAFAIDTKDPRWVLPATDALGRTEWYRSLPQDRQIEIGIYRLANIVKVGLQFEQVLISGIMVHLLGMENNRPEFRYSTHEATEECHHTQMFQEFVNRSGQDVPGAPRWFRKIASLLPVAAGPLPFVFFIGVLAGEEPIDHFQKQALRAGDQLHPLMERIMSIHVAEEARHIGFAHQYLEQRSKHLNRRQRALLSLTYPLVMRVLGDVIIKPSKKVRRQLGIPDEVYREVWWGSPDARQDLTDTFADVRTLAEELGLMNRASRRLWKALKIDGRPARFRSEPRRPIAA